MQHFIRLGCCGRRNVRRPQNRWARDLSDHAIEVCHGSTVGKVFRSIVIVPLRQQGQIRGLPVTPHAPGRASHV